MLVQVPLVTMISLQVSELATIDALIAAAKRIAGLVAGSDCTEAF